MLSKIRTWFKYWIVDKPELKAEEVEVSVDATTESGSVSVTATPTRVRNEAGKFVADDPSTPDVNEAWVGGKSPAKKSAKKKSK